MKTALLWLAALAGIALPAQTVVSNVRATDVGHSTFLLHFDIAGPTQVEGGYTVVFSYAKAAWAIAPASCLNNPAATAVPTAYVPGQASNNKVGPSFQFIVSGITPAGSLVNVCPSVSFDGQTWFSAQRSVQLAPVPAVHPAKPYNDWVPKGQPAYPDTTGWEVRAVPPDQASMDAAFSYAIAHSDTGVVLQLDHTKTYADIVMRVNYGFPVQPDVKPIQASAFSADANGNLLVTLPGHDFQEGDGINFARTYSALPNEAQHGCVGINVGRTYYAANVTRASFNLTCDAPLATASSIKASTPTAGVLVPFVSPANGNSLLYAHYPRRIKGFMIRTDAPDAKLPPPGTRATDIWAPQMPILQRTAANGNTSSDVFHTTLEGANIQYLLGKVWLMGLHILGAPVWTMTDGHPLSTSEDTTDITFDRVIVEGAVGYGTGMFRGIGWAGKNAAFINSTLKNLVMSSDEHYWDSWQPQNGMQAFEAGIGPGPFILENNAISGACNCIHFSDDGGYEDKYGYLIRRNHLSTPFQYAYGMPQSDGHLYGTRQILEFKSGKQGLIIGNVFDQSFHGLASSTLLFTSVDPNWGISDMEVAYNTFQHVFGATMAENSTQGGRLQSAPINRFWNHDNVYWDLNGFQYHSGKAGLGQYAGWVIQTCCNGEDFVFEHNLVYQIAGTAPDILHGGTPAEGVALRNNLLHIGQSSFNFGFGEDGGAHGRGQAYLDAMYPGIDYSGNILFSDGYTTAQLRGQFPSPLWSIPAAASDLPNFGWKAPSAGDFHLTGGGTASAMTAAQRQLMTATDGKMRGPNMTQLDIEQGVVYLGTPSRISKGTAQINFTAPDAQACPVDWEPVSGLTADPNMVLTFTRVPDPASNHNRDHWVRITGLPSGQVRFRVNCAVQQPTITLALP